MKDKDKQLINYRETAATRTKRRELEAHNEAVSSIAISLKSQDWNRDQHGYLQSPRRVLNPTRIALYRIYNNNSWKLGGRLYGGFWQLLPSADRELLQIDGAPVVECDFAHLHPTFLSDLAGVDFNGEDPYSIDGHELALVKTAFNTLLSANSEQAATKSLTRRLREDGVATPGEVTKYVIEAIKNRHPEFSEFWGTGLGLRLQHIDSDLCCRVLKKLRSIGVVALPIHDSFIVPEQAKGDLEEVMQAELYRTRQGLRRKPLIRQ